MNRRARTVLASSLVGILLAGPATAQWFRPQSAQDLKLTWKTERLGPSRILFLGDIQNLSGLRPAT